MTINILYRNLYQCQDIMESIFYKKVKSTFLFLLTFIKLYCMLIRTKSYRFSIKSWITVERRNLYVTKGKVCWK